MTATFPALSETKFHLPGQTGFYKGKVRDVYAVGDLLVMVATDRISAFDVVLTRAIPFKGQVLNQLAEKMMSATSDLIPNWIIDVPDPNVTIGKKCDPYKVEMVIRGYLTGHAWREYSLGKRVICGVKMADGLRQNDPFPQPIITPTTKASEGHDMDISREEIIDTKIVSEQEYLQLENYTRAVFKRGSEMAAKRGLILVDTKYEFGNHRSSICLIDEIHTPDSSRYFYSDTYKAKLKLGDDQRQLSKEFVRQWLIENNFQGKEGQRVPEMTDEWLGSISERYIELYEKMSGEKFIRADQKEMNGRIEKNIIQALERLA